MSMPIYKKSPKSFYHEMVPAQVTAIQSKVNTVLISRGHEPLPMKEGVVDNNFIRNVENAQRELGMKGANCDGKWGKHTQSLYMSFLKRELTEMEMLATGVEEPKLAAIPIPLKKQTKPIIKRKEESLYRLSFKTRHNHRVVITSTQSRRDMIKPGNDVLYDVYAKAFEKGNVEVYQKGRKIEMSKKLLDRFLDRYPNPTFVRQQLLKRKKTKA